MDARIQSLLPVLADDIYYDFIAYRKHIKDKNCYNDNWRDCGTDGKCPGDDSYIMPDEDGTEGNGFWNEGESGTEGNWKYDIGEPFDDTGSDGILDSQQKEIRKYIKKLKDENTISKGEYQRRKKKLLSHLWL